PRGRPEPEGRGGGFGRLRRHRGVAHERGEETPARDGAGGGDAMSDELDRLRDGLKAAPPAPDPGAKAAALRRAMETFDRHQESAAAARPMSDRPEGAGFLTGVRRMLAHLSPRAALAATASVAVIGLALALYPELRRAPGPPAPRPEAVAEKPANLPVAPAEAPLAELRKAEGETEADAVPAPAPPSVPEASAALQAAPTGAPGAEASVAEPAPSVAQARQKAGALTDSMANDVAGALGIVAPEATYIAPAPDTEAFANTAANPLKIAAEEPVSTFSVDTDTASWSVLRSSLAAGALPPKEAVRIDRKSTRLNSSHVKISYAVFCLKKKSTKRH